MSHLHGTRHRVESRAAKDGKPIEVAVWRYRRGWAGHAPLELARRRRRSKAARIARRRNRRAA